MFARLPALVILLLAVGTVIAARSPAPGGPRAAQDPDTCDQTVTTTSEWGDCLVAVYNDLAKRCVTDKSIVCPAKNVGVCSGGLVPATPEDILKCDLLITAAAVKEYGSASRLLQACDDLSGFDDANVACGCPIYTSVLDAEISAEALVASQIDGSFIIFTECLTEKLPITSLYYVPSAAPPGSTTKTSSTTTPVVDAAAAAFACGSLCGAASFGLIG